MATSKNHPTGKPRHRYIHKTLLSILNHRSEVYSLEANLQTFFKYKSYLVTSCHKTNTAYIRKYYSYHMKGATIDLSLMSYDSEYEISKKLPRHSAQIKLVSNNTLENCIILTNVIKKIRTSFPEFEEIDQELM